MSAGERRECESHNRGIFLFAAVQFRSDRTVVVQLRRQDVPQVGRRRPRWFFWSSTN